jgi:hypothetical protein
MEMPDLIRDATEYCVVFRRPPASCGHLGPDRETSCLLRLQIPGMTRTAQQLQNNIRERWGINVIVLHVQGSKHDGPGWALVELLNTAARLNDRENHPVPFASADLSSGDRRACELFLANCSSIPFAQVGWIDEAIDWLSRVTCRGFSRRSIEQLNAGGGFTLLRFCADDGTVHWLKATGVPNLHEMAVTSRLSKLCPEFLPTLVAIRPEWNAWVMENAGEALSLPADDSLLVGAIRRFAALQIRAIDAADLLLADGAFDHRAPTLLRGLDQIIAFLIEAMERQTSTKALPLKRDRLEELKRMLFDAIREMEDLGVPDTVLHNDLNLGNILYDGENCYFIDWSEAAVGNPFLSAERLRLLSGASASACGEQYRAAWREIVREDAICRAQSLAPLLSIFTCLYGRGDWLKDASKITPKFESYARSLARHMDRAAQSAELGEALCR